MLIARFIHPNSGHSYDKKICADLLELGKEYEVSSVDMYRFHTNIYLKDFPKAHFNSVNFEFYKDGKLHNIYKDSEYNPYLELSDEDD